MIFVDLYFSVVFFSTFLSQKLVMEAA